MAAAIYHDDDVLLLLMQFSNISSPPNSPTRYFCCMFLPTIFVLSMNEACKIFPVFSTHNLTDRFMIATSFHTGKFTDHDQKINGIYLYSPKVELKPAVKKFCS